MFKPGQQVKVRGLDMNCKPTVECVRFVRYLTDNTHYDCVTESRSGVKVMSNTDDFIQ